jgi:predicted ribosome-associated RNA-binding protein Tma20
MDPPEALPPFRAEEYVSVVVPGNPAAVAVGVAVIGREDALKRPAGKLVEVKQVGYVQKSFVAVL